MGSGELIDREPDTASWDILFTRYMAIQPNGTPYPVVGIYNNTKVYSNMFTNVAPDFSDWTSAPLDSTKSPIGWEWKSFNMTTMTWTVADTNTYFVHTWDRDIYKLVFTKFGGSGSGKVVFESTLLSPSSVLNPGENRNEVRLHPNPAVDQVTLSFSDEINGKAYITVYDMTGKAVFEAEREVENNSALVRLNEAGLQNGLYVLKVSAGGVSYSSKFMISKF
jgi:hypothetical protein